MDAMSTLTPPVTAGSRAWLHAAVARLEQEATRSADTHLLRLDFPGFPGIAFYFKDESSHPTGSLKHRLARSLYLYALCNGRLCAGQTVVDASSGSTAISEAWFARLLGLPFIAVMPACTAPQKIHAVQELGGQCDLVDDPTQVHARAAQHALEGACHLDQFGLAERATDWRGNNNIAESILGQLRRESQPVPSWIVCGAGTGGTSATIGRYLRYRRLDTRLCIAEPTGSGFVHGWRTRDRTAIASQPTLIEGIGRPRVEPGFLFDVVDDVIEVDDAAAVAAALQLDDLLGTRYGGSSGVNFIGCLKLAIAMRAKGESGSIVSLLCDRGKRYRETLFDPDWRVAHRLDIAPWQSALQATLAEGKPLDTHG
ncbi:MAG: pyridoxal-phosphate dependent enzyme [Thermomonas sp.]|nr:pyridoxal-phosphate dependent enzyme [Thermomonas sp.]